MELFFLQNIDHYNWIYKFSSGYNLLSFGVFEEYDTLKEILLEIVVSFLLSSLTLIIIMTPLIFLYFWVSYSVRYVKNFKKNKSLKTILIEKNHEDIKKLPRSKWPEYRRLYSKMIGFAVANITYTISANIYMFKSYKQVEVGLKEYFSFPFKVFKGLNTVDEASNLTIPLKEVWFGMLLIVGVSILVFFIVYFIVKTVLNAKLNRRAANSILPIRN